MTLPTEPQVCPHGTMQGSECSFCEIASLKSERDECKKEYYWLERDFKTVATDGAERFRRYESACSRLRERAEKAEGELDEMSGKYSEQVQFTGAAQRRAEKAEGRVAELEEVCRRASTARGYALEKIARLEMPDLLAKQRKEYG